MSNIINSITLENYRGFKEECELTLAGINNITFLVGPNNSGKSLITRVLSIFKMDLHKFTTNIFPISYFQDSDFHDLQINKPVRLKFNINTQTFQETDILELRKLLKIDKVNLCIDIKKLVDGFYGYVYINGADDYTHHFENDSFKYKVNNKLSRTLDMEHNETENLCKILFTEVKKRILVFDSIRSFDRMQSDFYKNGSELIDWLHQEESKAEIRNARATVRGWLKSKFNLDEPTHVRADFKNKRLIFSFNDIDFSSDEIGTGYTMLYILLMELVRNQKELVMIDEIESHLQPGLIRILISLLRDYGRAQYVIATHSSTVMESASSEDILYRFNKKEGVCNFENFFRSTTQLGKFREVCNELGVIPGDALLSNTVIWVEGPSEMFWIRAWMKHYFPIYKKKNGVEGNLIEGLHYNILMTGGSNISHYSFQEGELSLEILEEEELLKVLKVNPNPFVIIDSDNSKVESAKFQRMIRIAQDLNKINKLNPKFEQQCMENISQDNISSVINLWILKGRELENYAHPQLLKDFYEERASQRASLITGVDLCADWDVFHRENGAGKLLEDRGVTRVAKKSGTLIHKNDFARYVFQNLKPVHFDKEPVGMKKPNQEMLEDLINNLDKILNYILTINNIKKSIYA
ncbi:ATP-dependent nuclease [Priestia megaterium]|uniref:ATP-dependent nuclease n=1 Tax=Priestia megaterium TaxID=1404 RepID=UPI001C22222F|nr:AAA family ATPase [Priestia megaterium]MBU8754128.1 ATP-binding protein [Priestia megaterium]